MMHDRRAYQNGSSFFSGQKKEEGTPSGADVFAVIFFLLKSESETLVRCLTFFPPVLQFNFVGKLLGPRGNSMKRLQEETGVKMSILGKGSMRDKDKVGKIGLFVFQHLSMCLAVSRDSSDLRLGPE